MMRSGVLSRYCALALYCLCAVGAGGCSFVAVQAHTPPPVEDQQPPSCPSYIWGIADGTAAAGAATWGGWNVYRLATGPDGPVETRNAVTQLLVAGTLTTMYGFSSFVGIMVAGNCRNQQNTEMSTAPALRSPPD